MPSFEDAPEVSEEEDGEEAEAQADAPEREREDRSKHPGDPTGPEAPADPDIL